MTSARPQDIDPSDFLRTQAEHLSGGAETTIKAAISVMAPNPDSALIGNPEEIQKWMLTSAATLESMPWGGDKVML